MSAPRPGDADVTGVVTGVRDAHRFDEDALARWLAPRLPGADRGVRVRQFEGGQSNPTYLLETDEARWVLRKKPSGPLLASAHMIEREQRVMTALRGSGVPVPEVPLFCEDASIIGTPFFVMAYVHGRIVRDPGLPGVSVEDRRAVYREAVETLAALHDVDWAARGLADFGKPTDYAARQIARWSRQYRDAQSHPVPAMDWLMAWLPEHVPAQAQVSIAHGDYRLDNLVFHPTEPRVLAVLDWELSTLGDPLTDLAYFAIPHHLDHKRPASAASSGRISKRWGSPRRRRSSMRTARAAASRLPRPRRWPFISPLACFASRRSSPGSRPDCGRATPARGTRTRSRPRRRPSPTSPAASPRSPAQPDSGAVQVRSFSTGNLRVRSFAGIAGERPVRKSHITCSPASRPKARARSDGPRRKSSTNSGACPARGGPRRRRGRTPIAR